MRIFTACARLYVPSANTAVYGICRVGLKARACLDSELDSVALALIPGILAGFMDYFPSTL